MFYLQLLTQALTSLPQYDAIFPVRPYAGHHLFLEETESIFSTQETCCQWPYNLSGNLRSNRDLEKKMNVLKQPANGSSNVR